FADQHHGTPHIALLVRTGSMDELLALVEDQPEVYFKPAYYGASGWVGIILNRPGVDWDAVAAWLERSWRGAAPKRLTRLMDVADAF
ncbi:MAG TPA: MmcQ/YjbR family DNA-binding protein, partial [Erythrobacter sp.]